MNTISEEIINHEDVKKPINVSSLVVKIIILMLVGVSIYTLLKIDNSNLNLLDAINLTFKNLRTMFLDPRLTHFSFFEGVYQVGIALSLAILTTFIGAIFAVLLAVFSARNISKKSTAQIINFFISFIRAVPTVLWVLIFAVALGLGSEAAVIGMTFHTVSYLTKAFTEAFEEIDKSALEALRGSGASWWQIVFQSVIPSSLSEIMSWMFIRFEINFANAIAMGAAAGAGGIGFELFMAGNFYFDIREVGAITYYILIVAIVLEMIANKMKVKLKVNY